MKRTTKTFIGGAVLGTLLGAIIGGFTIAMVLGTAFINYSLSNTTIHNVQPLQSLTKAK